MGNPLTLCQRSYKQPCAQSKSGAKRQIINLNKTVIIPFTRKRELNGLKEPSLFNRRIQLSSEVKYLGITLDKGLTWKKQLDKAINKAYKAFWTCRGTFGKTWGLKPKVVYWIYTEVARPIITYGGPELHSKQVRQNLANCKGWPAWESRGQ
jgi:hypothetical protein